MFKKGKKKRLEILEKQRQIKEEDFDFERIALFFEHDDHKEAEQIIGDRTLNDLDFEDLFISLDRTSSSVGQQYLYSKLRVIPKVVNQSKLYDQYINRLSREQKDDVIIELSTLNSHGAYFLQRLFFGEQISRPKWFWLIPVCSISLVISLVLSIFNSQVFILVLLLAGVNTLIHLWNKNNVMGYVNTIPELLKLHKVATTLNEKKLLLSSKEAVGVAIKRLNKIRSSAFFFKWEPKTLDEIVQAFEYLIDLIKGAFLIEPIVFFRLLRQIESNKADIKTLYEAVGEVDMVISLDSWRNSLPYYCTPEFSDSTIKTWNSESLFHPLIQDPITNDLEVADQKSILLSGSNMSGKTTFIRTIGINALLAQTINTVCARKLTLSNFKIYSAIRITDDLYEQTSYYYEEVKTIKKFAEESHQQQFNLFLLDEIFKGTNTIERIASGKAVLSYLNDPTNLIICSTHDLELIDYLQEEYEFYHFVESIEEGQITFDYQLKKGDLKNTNAIRILEINGFPKVLTDEARSLAGELLKVKRMANEKIKETL